MARTKRVKNESTSKSQKNLDKPKRVRKKCVHGKERTMCKGCGGSGICLHGRRKSRCKECGGSEICEHGRRKSRCKECGGSEICEHGRRKSQCKECGGSEICEHGRLKRECKGCGGASICKHGRRKSRCKECGGSEICEHGRITSQCKECGGPSICKHDRRKSHCKDCEGSNICKHGRQKNVCKECGGSSICKHGRQKNVCKECGGSKICEHDKNKFSCSECLSFQTIVSSKKWCKICFKKQLSHARIRSGIVTCAECDPTVPDRIEHIIGDKIIDIIGYPPFAADDTLFGGSLCGEKDEKQRRPDLAWCIDYGRVVVVCEVDEKGGHPNEIIECELGRIWTLTDAFKKLMGEQTQVFFIRINPDEFDGGIVSLDERVEIVSDRIQWLLEMEDDELEQFDKSIPHIGYYFYHSKCHFQIEAAKKCTESMKVMEVYP